MHIDKAGANDLGCSVDLERTASREIDADLTDALIFHPNVGTITECTGAIYDGASTQQQVSGVCFHFICLQ